MAERERNTFYDSRPPHRLLYWLQCAFVSANSSLANCTRATFRRYGDVGDDDSLKFEGSIRMEKEVALSDSECGRHAGSVLQRVGLHVVWCLCVALNNFSFLPKWVWFQVVSAIF